MKKSKVTKLREQLKKLKAQRTTTKSSEELERLDDGIVVKMIEIAEMTLGLNWAQG